MLLLGRGRGRWGELGSHLLDFFVADGEDGYFDNGVELRRAPFFMFYDSFTDLALRWSEAIKLRYYSNDMLFILVHEYRNKQKMQPIHLPD